MQLASFDDVNRALRALEQAPPAGAYWPLSHCAQSIEYAVQGYPKPKPWIVRALVGPMVLRRFLARGAMSHDVAATIPGAPVIEREGDVAQACARLRAAITAFRAAAVLQPHFAYGPVERAQYERVQAMHVADHLTALGL
jgi:hypothetical protein